MEVFVFSLSTVPFIGIGLLVIGLVGFVIMAIVLDDYPGLFALIICWYALAISCAVMALGKAAGHTGPSQLAIRKQSAEGGLGSAQRL